MSNNLADEQTQTDGEQCENCGERKAVATRTACLDVPELDEQRAKTLTLCRPCTNAFDWGAGTGPVGHGLPEARSESSPSPSPSSPGRDTDQQA